MKTIDKRSNRRWRVRTMNKRAVDAYTTNLSDIDRVDSYETLGLILSHNF